MNAVRDADTNLYRAVNRLAAKTPALHAVLAAYALWGGVTILAVMLIAAYGRSRWRSAPCRPVATAAATGVGVVVALLANQHLFSPLIARTRPCHALTGVEVVLTCANDYSFPSDHCVMAGAFAAGFAFLGRRWFVPALVLAVLLAFSRVYVGVHYPSDVVAGLVLGAAFGAGAVLGLRPALTALAERLAAGPAYRLVGTVRVPVGGAHARERASLGRGRAGP